MFSELHLSINDCISQYYDGASVVSGCHSDVSAMIPRQYEYIAVLIDSM